MLNESLKSVVIITCWYGQFPWYFSYYIQSCSFNPSIDFCIITDNNDPIINQPANVKVIYKTLKEIEDKASLRLEFKVNIQNPYKLCDFKPAYGFIFSELIENYDFWGHGDIDLIFGNIRTFITNELLNNYDLISVRPDWVPGCFLLFKNTKKMNLLFTQSKDYEKVFRSGTHYCFDETNFSHGLFTDGYKYSEISTEIESMMHVIKRLEELHQIRPYFDLHIVEGRPGRLKWCYGILTYRNQFEVLLYHLIKLKEVYQPKKAHKEIRKTFFISPTRIY